jgi:hypothetical protein
LETEFQVTVILLSAEEADAETPLGAGGVARVAVAAADWELDVRPEEKHPPRKINVCILV